MVVCLQKHSKSLISLSWIFERDSLLKMFLVLMLLMISSLALILVNTFADNEALVKPVCYQEILNAINSIGPLKAPGPDGLHAIFFQQNWNEVKDSIDQLVGDFFDNGTDLINTYEPYKYCSYS